MTTERIPQKYIDMLHQYDEAVASRDWATCDALADELTDTLGPNWLHRTFLPDQAAA